ncbi:MAG: hypothetical protein AB7G25_17555 [Sphingomonadaceae bacterium]
MEQHSTSSRSDFSPVVPSEMMIAGWQMMQLPPILMAAWWNQMMQAFLPFMPVHHRHPHFHEEHDQLVVPDPIEEEGEHALFA